MRIMAASWRLERQRIIVIVTIIIIIIIIVVVVIVVIVVVVVVSIALVIIIIIRSLFGLETTLPQESRARASRRTPWMHLTFPTPVAESPSMLGGCTLPCVPVRPQALDIWSVRPQAFQRT